MKKSLSVLIFALAITQMSFAGPVSGCINGPNSNVDYGPPTGIVAYTQFVCSLYPAAGSYTIDLTPNMTYGGASVLDNAVGAGYLVVINGDPSSLSDDNSGLWNQSLWAAVLYFPGDQWDGVASDSLTVYWNSFPSASVIDTFDQSLYGPTSDSDFFIQAVYPETVYDAGPGPNEYDLYLTPEPSSLLLLGTGIASLAGILRRKLRA